MPGRKYTDEQKDEIVQLYREGLKGEIISERTGVPRPTVYLILEQRGIKPSRRKVMRARQVAPEQLLEQIAERDRYIGRLELELEQAQRTIEVLQDQLTAAAGSNGGQSRRSK